MKNTIKISISEALVIQPKGEGVQLDVMMFGVSVASKVIDLNAVGALMFALEQAAEVAERARMLAAAQAQAQARAA